MLHQTAPEEGCQIKTYDVGGGRLMTSRSYRDVTLARKNARPIFLGGAGSAYVGPG